ncbi:MAG: amino acid permease [Alphaproteobacteria bacterium]|nr:amino acid permease [Alphaproteobacteria bacterium]
MLRRVLGVPLLVLYGLGVIIGAGIYVLVGPVIAVAGDFAPLSFLLAGAVAALIALCYAELAARFPEAAGAAAYVKEAFGSDLLSRLTGLAVGVVTLTSTGAVLRGSVGYAQFFVGLPAPAVIAGLAVAATAVACIGVRDSVSIAAAMTVVEIGGLVAVIAAGWSALPGPGAAAAALPAQVAALDARAVVLGAFLSFFAFIGFENMVNMAEETRDTQTTLPRALVASIALSTLLYVLVAGVAVGSPAPLDGDTPLLAVGAASGWFSRQGFAAVALVAVSNGILIEILMLSRLLYGMARRGWAPGFLGAVHPRTATPVAATLVAGGAVLALALAFDARFLAGATSAITLVVFAVVSAGLWRLQRRDPRGGGFRAPRPVPPLAALLCLGLVAAQLWLG